MFEILLASFWILGLKTILIATYLYINVAFRSWILFKIFVRYCSKLQYSFLLIHLATRFQKKKMKVSNDFKGFTKNAWSIFKAIHSKSGNIGFFSGIETFLVLRDFFFFLGGGGVKKCFLFVSKQIQRDFCRVFC